MSRSSLLRLGALLLLVTLAAVAIWLLPVGEVVERARAAGPWGPVLLGLFYVPAAVLLIPGSLITLGGAAAFGLTRGLIAVSLGSTAGAAAAFLLGRTLARPWIETRVAANPRFQAIDRAIGDKGFRIVLLLRLSPVFPYTILNYALGLTRISFGSYLLASWLGMLPGTIMYVYLGTALGDLALAGADTPVGTAETRWLFYIGLAATVIVTIYVTHLARRALSEAVPETEPVPLGGSHG